MACIGFLLPLKGPKVPSVAGKATAKTTNMATVSLKAFICKTRGMGKIIRIHDMSEIRCKWYARMINQWTSKATRKKWSCRRLPFVSHLPCKATCLITLISPFREDNYQVPKTIFTVVQNQYIFKKLPENKITVDYLFNTRALIKAFISEAALFSIRFLRFLRGFKNFAPNDENETFFVYFQSIQLQKFNSRGTASKLPYH